MLEVNLTGAGLLGVQRSSLIHSPFILFIAPEFRPLFSAHLRQVFASSTRQTCKLQLATRAGDSFHVTLESRAADSRQNGLRECRSVMSDLEEIRQQRDELKELNQLITEQSEQILSAYLIVTELSKALNLDETVKTFVSFLQEHLNLEKHVLVLLDDAGGVQVVNVAGSLPNQASILTSCLKNSEEFYAMLSSGLRMAKGEYSEAPDCLTQFFENWVIWPFKGKQRALGFLLLDDPGPGARDPLTIIINQTAVFIENAILYENMAAVNQQLTLANLRLMDLDQQKTNFLNTVAHDLRNPLTSILSYADLLLMYPDESKETQQEFLAIIRKESVRLGNLITDFQDLARIESGTIKYADQALDVTECINHTLSVYRGEATRRGIALSAEFEPGLPEIFADPNRICQVLAKLISNAMKFTPDRGRIQVTARESVELFEGHSRPVLQVAVADTGPGIDPQHHRLIFKKFAQVENSAARVKGGTGLGLAISREIIAHYGGRIWVESELGQGARFVFTLPTNPVSSQQAASGEN